MNKWSILIEVDAENIKEFNAEHLKGNALYIVQEDVIGIMKIEPEVT
jgi:hypothetical protein